MSHEKIPYGLTTLQNDYEINDSKIYNTMSSAKYSIQNNPQVKSTDMRELRLGKQPRNNNNLNTHTYDGTKDSSKRFGFLYPDENKDAYINIDDSYSIPNHNQRTTLK
jgi:hypothetical protein